MTGPLFAFYLSTLGILGLLIGSFLNVVAYRVPIGMSIVKPRSSCPGCKHEIAAYDNLPLISWLLLRGKCRHCATPIPDRYPLVEALTALTWMALGIWAWQPDAVDPTGAPALMIDPLLPTVLIVASIGIALWLIDLDHLRLPDVLTLPLYPIIAVGLVVAGLVTGEWNVLTAVLSMLGWALFFGSLWFFTGGRGMGFGDVKLAPALALLLGWVGAGASIIGLFAGFLIGGVVGIILLARAKAGRRTRVPYGPYLLLGAFVGLLVGQPLWNAYTTAMGF